MSVSNISFSWHPTPETVIFKILKSAILLMKTPAELHLKQDPLKSNLELFVLQKWLMDGRKIWQFSDIQVILLDKNQFYNCH